MSQTQTKGAYLKDKLENMTRWVIGEVGKENLPVDILAGIAGRSELEVTAFAGKLESNSVQVAHRDWHGLAQLLPLRELQEVVTAIKQRPSMHDKFWRYMELFIEIVRQ
jgi:hypothetical protein